MVKQCNIFSFNSQTDHNAAAEIQGVCEWFYEKIKNKKNKNRDIRSIVMLQNITLSRFTQLFVLSYFTPPPPNPPGMPISYCSSVPCDRIFNFRYGLEIATFQGTFVFGKEEIVGKGQVRRVWCMMK
jgi:hypothetical protein